MLLFLEYLARQELGELIKVERLIQVNVCLAHQAFIALLEQQIQFQYLLAIIIHFKELIHLQEFKFVHLSFIVQVLE